MTKGLTEQIVHIQNDLDVVFAEVVKLEKRLEVSKKEHYRTLEQLRIATKALKKYQEAINRFKKDPMNNIIMLAHQLIYDIDIDSKKALKEMEGVK